MIDDALILQNISKISDQSYVIRKRSLYMESILFNAFCYLELQFEKGLEFRKQDALYKMMDALQSSDDKLQAMSGNKDFTDEQLDSVHNDIELMELTVSMYKNAVKTNDAYKRYLEMVSQICHWLLKECQSQKIPIPKGYKLSKMIQNEGFVIKYPKPTDLLLREDPTVDVTEPKLL